MGTKLEYFVNLLAALPDSNNLTVGHVDVWEHFQNQGLRKSYHIHRIGVDKLQSLMDRMIDRNNTESIKKTMQMHEDTFKHQVRELHRLYSVQKMLMNQLKKETRQTKFWSATTGLDILSHPRFIDQQPPTKQINSGIDVQFQRMRDYPCSREMSGSCSGDTMRLPRGFDLERPAEEGISIGLRSFDEGRAGPSSSMAIKSCKMNMDISDEDSDVELTLSIGGMQTKKRTNSHQPQLGCSESPKKKNGELNSSASFKSDRGEECSDPSTPISSSSVTFELERKRPNWLFQGLKLK
ncbi:A-kinase anchor protein 9, putative isoform 1 [Quillaja saponaria]|uniref:A-kinase anchor protein 9, putative isoform 1 n=1 Tax=Quillaja saponaria TaxID=32244 RepID=A0AAD7LD30_QUISA|nr:A-kinase anchor protein 9, putative isoform 1 [Quillaja saponaria]KAJ7955808.1 A-kinase anchor protein 9, putative isoform 1 [Quillaja saponaria]